MDSSSENNKSFVNETDSCDVVTNCSSENNKSNDYKTKPSVVEHTVLDCSPGKKNVVNEGKASAFEKPLDLDDVLVNELGQLGWFQLRVILLVAVPIMMAAFMSEYIFSAAAIPHR